MWEPSPSPSSPGISPVLTTPAWGQASCLAVPTECSLCPSPFAGLCVPKPHPTTLSLSVPKHFPLPLAGMSPGQSCSCSGDGRGTTPSPPPWPLVPSTASAFLCQGFFPRLEPVNNPGVLLLPSSALCSLSLFQNELCGSASQSCSLPIQAPLG